MAVPWIEYHKKIGVDHFFMYYDGSNWVRLGAGTAGQSLKTAGSGANPYWG